MSKNEDKLLLLLFVYRLLSPKYLPRFWPKTVKADLGTRKLVHGKGREDFGEDVTEGFAEDTEGSGEELADG